MVKARSSASPGHITRGPKSTLARLRSGILLIPLGLCLVLAAGIFVGDASYLWYLASRATVLDTWSLLALVSAMLSLTAIAGAAFALSRRRPILALAVSLLALPTHAIMEGSRCDTEVTCRQIGWAALPARAFGWNVRIRPVIDANEARAIASQALARSNIGDTPYREKRFENHWIVSTINDDGWPGARAVRIDTRTAETILIPCPGDKIRCGMERPTVSDGASAFRNEQVGIAATFPASRPVCTSRGDDEESRGFFAPVRASDIPCEVIDRSREMGVEVAPYRMNGCTVVDAPLLPWIRLTPETAQLFETTPALGAAPSLTCELRQDDQIQISVYATAESPSAPDESGGALYEAYIVTTPAHLSEDVRAFETFLKTVSIGAAR